jgi:hypothetical protein
MFMRQVAGLAAAVMKYLPAVADRAAARVGLLQDDVDDAGDGVGAVLGRGALLQHLDVVDRAQR